MNPPFRFFKKKNTLPQIKPPNDQNRTTDAINISISNALEELAKVESEHVMVLSNNLAPIKEDVTRTLRSIQKVADELEKDKIKLEEDKFKSIVKNSKATVVTTLKRETSLDLPLPNSAYNAKRFKERLESIVNRFGEVSSSHSRVFNAFMKKYAEKLKNEFETLSSLLKDTKYVIDIFEKEGRAITECYDLLNSMSHTISGIESNKIEIGEKVKEIEKLDKDLKELYNKLKTLEGSPEFQEAVLALEEVNIIKKEEQEFHKQLLSLFGHLSRAITKYSYGMKMETIRRLHVLTDQPWKIFDDDTSVYIKLLYDIRTSIESYNIELKDSDKAIQYCDIILKSLPEFHDIAKTRRLRLELLNKAKTKQQMDTSAKIREIIKDHNETIERNKVLLEQLRNEMDEKNRKLEGLAKKAENNLMAITGKKFSIYI